MFCDFLSFFFFVSHSVHIHIDKKLLSCFGFSAFKTLPPCGLADILNSSHARRINQGHTHITWNFLCVQKHVAIKYKALSSES